MMKSLPPIFAVQQSADLQYWFAVGRGGGPRQMFERTRLLPADCVVLTVESGDAPTAPAA
jgi:hypothetical protein